VSGMLFLTSLVAFLGFIVRRMDYEKEIYFTSRNDVNGRLSEFVMVYFKRQFTKERRRWWCDGLGTKVCCKEGNDD